MRRPVRPKDAVHAGIMQAKTLMTTMIAKLDQKSRPMLGPTIPVLTVATAMFALNLAQSVKWKFRCHLCYMYQKVQAFQTRCVLWLRSSSVMRWMPPVSIDSTLTHKPRRVRLFTAPKDPGMDPSLS